MSKERKFKLTRRDFLIGTGVSVLLYLFAEAGWKTNQKKNTQNYIEQAKGQGVILFSKIKKPEYIEFLAKDNKKIKFLLSQLKAAKAAKDYQALQEIQIQLAIEVASVITWQERHEKISFRAEEIVLVPFRQNPNNPEFRDFLKKMITFPLRNICHLKEGIPSEETAILLPDNPLLLTVAALIKAGEQNFEKIVGDKYSQGLTLRLPIPTSKNTPSSFVPLSPSSPQEEKLLHELISKSSCPIWHATVIIPTSQ